MTNDHPVGWEGIACIPVSHSALRDAKLMAEGYAGSETISFQNASNDLFSASILRYEISNQLYVIFIR
nr:Uncharacterised protein [Klebsiella pneumoniae]